MRLTCQQVSRLLSQAQDQPLSLGEHIKLRLHLSVCDACSNFRRSLGFIRQAARRTPPQP
ncbi:hypothetical protein THUN1379_32750 [Paludibacterium sp. THUN1379]|uniref:zf-HC2 domain-containing protein n=1 Tax=Paludibacterium sp. THUN1379 TaxID=3112107 RepID=UPI00308ECB07|nr:hypothetical protein THUN1379_32750 [Paludibacterium sp. THUN1379]